MITYPFYWKNIGVAPNIQEIEDTLQGLLFDLGCNNLALSGGIDSSYMLWNLVKIFKNNVNCYTIAINEHHPDVQFSKMITSRLGVRWKVKLTGEPTIDEGGDNSGDSIVRTFFNWLNEEGVDGIICCDGIDEFMGGYYAHLHNPTNETYYNFMSKLQKEQLEPLNRNSGNVKVKLPYIVRELIELYNCIPMSERFGTDGRKKIMVQLAKGKIPQEIINRRKYGFCDAMTIKEEFDATI